LKTVNPLERGQHRLVHCEPSSWPPPSITSG